MGAVELDGLLHEVIAGADAGTPQIVVAQFQVPRGYRKPDFTRFSNISGPPSGTNSDHVGNGPQSSAVSRFV